MAEVCSLYYGGLRGVSNLSENIVCRLSNSYNMIKEALNLDPGPTYSLKSIYHPIKFHKITGKPPPTDGPFTLRAADVLPNLLSHIIWKSVSTLIGSCIWDPKCQVTSACFRSV